MPKVIDLRSDTVTRPTPGMKAAMANAELGDDVFGDDPTVNRLQRRFAEMTGKEDALFVTSGTQGNQVCIRAHTRPGDEVICDGNSHIVNYETGAPAALSGTSIFPLNGPRGTFTAEMVERAVRPDNVHFPVSRLVVVENTHNRGGGSIWPIDLVRQVGSVARARGLKTHLDGARIWNAVVATGVPLIEWAKNFDSLTACFSKGLGCPVGSIVAGPRDFIRACRRFRKMFGGALRQVGVLAAAAEYALDHHVERLAEDHANAGLLAQGLSQIEDFAVEPDLPTNMVFWGIRNPAIRPEDVLERCKRAGVLFAQAAPGRFRAVCHLDVNRADIQRAVEIIQEQVSAVGV
jgi:threonine aldolase